MKKGIKRMLSAIACAALAMGCLAGCGSNAGSSTTGTTTEAATENASTAASEASGDGAVADGKVVYDFSLVIQRVQFFILISGQPVIEPDFHNRSFPLWCADHARHTIAHKFRNSHQNKSGDFCFYFSNKISGLICIWMIHRQIVVDHHFQKIIKLIVRTHIGIHDACDIGLLSLSTHSAPFSRNQFGQ